MGDGEKQVNGDHACAHTVFLSYASQDSAVALNVCEALMPLDIAEVYAYHNDKDRAFEWLERQYRVDPNLLDLHSDPLLANLRGDPRFEALLRKLKLPE